MSIKAINKFDHQWQEKHPYSFQYKGETHYSHRRKIFISSPDSIAPRLVVKIETSAMRDIKLQLVLPHAEEISYKICKLLHWNTVPKTKILHQYSVAENQTGKPQKYVNLISCFEGEINQLTFTFQTFMEGKTFGDFEERKWQDLDLSSYQKAYLLDMVLGKFDGNKYNTILNHTTHELFEIDNEYIGKQSYCDDGGILNDFGGFKSDDLPEEILNDVLSATLSQLVKIREKYTAKDTYLTLLWSEEPHPVTNDCGRLVRDLSWSNIMKNFVFLKMSILRLREQQEPITIEKLEKGISKLYLRDLSVALFHSSVRKMNYLHKASLFSIGERFLEILIKESSPMLEQKDANSRTPLDLAISQKRRKCIELLIKYGANISDDNRKSLEGKEFACIHERIGIGACLQKS